MNTQQEKTILDSIAILDGEINEHKCSRGGVEVFFKLMGLGIEENSYNYEDGVKK
jgi:hypothetical protein